MLMDVFWGPFWLDVLAYFAMCCPFVNMCVESGPLFAACLGCGRGQLKVLLV